MDKDDTARALWRRAAGTNATEARRVPSRTSIGKAATEDTIVLERGGKEEEEENLTDRGASVCKCVCCACREVSCWRLWTAEVQMCCALLECVAVVEWTNFVFPLVVELAAGERLWNEQWLRSAGRQTRTLMENTPDGHKRCCSSNRSFGCSQASHPLPASPTYTQSNARVSMRTHNYAQLWSRYTFTCLLLLLFVCVEGIFPTTTKMRDVLGKVSSSLCSLCGRVLVPATRLH